MGGIEKANPSAGNDTINNSIPPMISEAELNINGGICLASRAITTLVNPALILVRKSNAIPMKMRWPVSLPDTLPRLTKAIPAIPIKIIPNLGKVNLSSGMKKCEVKAINSGPAPIMIAPNAPGTRFNPL